MAYSSIYDEGVRSKTRRVQAELGGKPVRAKTRKDRVRAALAENEPIAEGFALGQFFKEWIEGGAHLEECRARSAAVSEFFDRNVDALQSVEAADRIVRAAVWEEKENRVRELVSPLYGCAGRGGETDPITLMAAQAGNYGRRSMGGRITRGAERLRDIFAGMSGVAGGSIDYTKPKVDTSMNAKRDWMPVNGKPLAGDTMWYRLARIMDLVGSEKLVMMIRMAVFAESLKSVALLIEDDEAALASHQPRERTLKAAGAMVRGGLAMVADRGL